MLTRFRPVAARRRIAADVSSKSHCRVGCLAVCARRWRIHGQHDRRLLHRKRLYELHAPCILSNIPLAIATAGALLVAYFTGNRVLTVRVEPEGISYARGRENLQWTSATWSNVAGATQKSRTIAAERPIGSKSSSMTTRGKLKIPQSITDYAGLRDLLASMTAGQIR